MELRLIVMSGDSSMAEMLRAQAENIGCRCNSAAGYDEAVGELEWADAVLIDLAGDGIADLTKLRKAAPDLHTLAIAVDVKQARRARKLGADLVLEEPFAIPDLVEGIRSLQAPASDVVDLRDAEVAPVPEPDDAPWWATR